mmetsp:Transcript_18830/g.21031  ORF Transcript_18830/g.21031 Transcript_18830/m.21031 type:complete len:622 (+) Transcript_18830:96-1961(+)
MVRLLPQSSTPFLVRANACELGAESSLQQPCPESHSEPILVTQTLYHQHEWRSANLLHHGLVHDVECGLVDESNIDALLLETLHGVQASVRGVAEGHDVPIRSFPDHIIDARLELVVVPVHRGTVLFQEQRQLGASGEHETKALIEVNRLDALLEGLGISREVEASGLVILQTIVGKEVIQAKVTGVICHVVHAAVAEVAQEVAVVEASHGDFTAAHLEEGSEGTENTLLSFLSPEAGSCRQVPALHNAAKNEHLRVSLVNHIQACGSLQVAVDHLDAVHPLLQRHGVQDVRYNLSEEFAVGVPLARPQVLPMGVLRAFDGLQVGSRLVQTSAFKVLHSSLLVDHVMSVRAALNSLDARSHLALADHRVRSIRNHGSADAVVQSVQILARNLGHRKAVSPEGVGHGVATHVLGWVASDGHIVVVNQQLDVQVLGHGQTSGLSVIALLLRAVRPKAEHDLVRVGQGHTVDIRPHVTEASRAKLNSRGETKLRVPRQLLVALSVVNELIRVQVTAQGRHEVLCGDTVSSLIIENGYELVRATTEERIQNHHLRCGVECTTSVASVTAGTAGSSEEDDDVAAQLDVGLQHPLLLRRQASLSPRIDLERLKLGDVHMVGKVEGHL